MTADQLSIDDAITQRDQTLRRIHHDTDPTDRNVIRRAILTIAAQGRPFSSNQVRPLLPVLKSNNTVGPVYGALVREGLIRRVGYEPSTDPATRGHPVAVYRADLTALAADGGDAA